MTTKDVLALALTREEITDIRAIYDSRPYSTYNLCRAIEAAVIAKAEAAITAIKQAQQAQEPVGINGLTEAETSTSMSVIGLSKPAPKQAEPEGYKLVPVIPTEAQWNGLARDMMMWLDMDGRHTACSLFKHLERCGTEIPQWLRDEPEMKNLDHVPSKGTRVAIIYRAMLAAAPTPPEAK
jgi:hypothetical protein